MKRIFLLAIILAAAITSNAQQVHFIYLQTDNNQPFYVKLNNQLHSSSSSGYVVIPKLQNGSYNIIIGFPKNQWPLQTMPVKIDNDDLGFIIKNFGDKGWGLFNIQTLNVTMSTTTPKDANNAQTQTRTDNFSNILADVVNTPSIKEEKIKPVVTEAKPVVKEQAAVPATKPVSKIINIISTSLDNSGRSTIYVDNSNNNHDTITIFIPYKNAASITKDTIAIAKKVEDKATESQLPKIKPSKNDISQNAELVKSDHKDTIVVNETPKKLDEPKSDSKFLDIELPNPNSSKDSIVVHPAKNTIKPNTTKPAEKADLPSAAASSTAEKLVSTNSDCRKLASDNDFLKLRKKMAAKAKDDDMIDVAKKQLKSTCFSTEQIKNLSVLFLDDEGRYKFFDAAYPFVYDSKKFSTLQEQLSDTYYINRFKAMIKH
jgi:hypothetical protein